MQNSNCCHPLSTINLHTTGNSEKREGLREGDPLHLEFINILGYVLTSLQQATVYTNFGKSIDKYTKQVSIAD